MVLPYYRRLSQRDRAVYRQSAAITDVPLPDARACRPLASELEEALASGDRTRVEAAAKRLVARIAHQLGTEPVAVRVLARRPRSATEELHGLYTREEGRRALIQVWMRTAQRKQVASFRTFLRTLLHELCHHLDYVHFGLADSFHTEGFFRRESSLMRQLVPARRGSKAPKAPRASKKGGPAAKRSSGSATPPDAQVRACAQRTVDPPSPPADRRGQLSLLF